MRSTAKFVVSEEPARIAFLSLDRAITHATSFPNVEAYTSDQDPVESVGLVVCRGVRSGTSRSEPVFEGEAGNAVEVAGVGGDEGE